MMKKIFLSLITLAAVCGINAQTVKIMQGSNVVATYTSAQYSKVVFVEKTQSITEGSAAVLSSAGRDSCNYVQLWAGGPKWASFNVGATITDYANLTPGTDPTPLYGSCDETTYCNTANMGGLYAWNNPNINGRQATWDSSTGTGISDVATTLWGSNWKTPTHQQMDTLHDSSYGKTTWTWCDGSTTQYVAGCTLAGYKVSGVGEYARMCIFLPAAGFFDYTGGVVSGVGYGGNYWLLAEDSADDAYTLNFDSDWHGTDYGYLQEQGYSLRAILAE